VTDVDRNITHFLRASASQFGSKTALVTTQANLTYTELMDRASRFGAALARLGGQPGERVTLYSPNCWEWVVAYYGSLMAGMVINPVNVMLTSEEVVHVLGDCGASMLIGSAEKLGPLCQMEQLASVREIICFDGDMPAKARRFNDLLSDESPLGSPSLRLPEHTCAIGYTSGTTGHPKGAMHSHRNVLMNAQLTALMHGRSENDVVVTALPMPHVYGTVVLNSTLLTGGTLVLHPRFDELEILTSIQSQAATLFEGVPTMYFFLLNHPRLREFDFTSLRMCTVGGQTMPPAKMAQVEALFGCPLVELWGMTELAGLGTTFAHSGPVRHGSIGVPLPYCEAKIVDIAEAGQDLPRGEAGELMIRGPVVMQGFYGNESATRETIEPDGWLHTGDIARIDQEGFIYIVDRKKDVILTAGYNVYPAEIERVVAAHPDVAMVAVGPIPDEAKGELAKAYIVPKLDSKPDAAAIISFCREHLAAYKVPRAIQFVADLPKTSSGKIMRRRLKELDQA
jgi:long-chain acyl-CoA synthetase